MKTLLILRHAKAERPDGCPDIERPLAEKGVMDAKLIGGLLKEAEMVPDALFSSKAKRAMETAKIAAEKMGLPPDRIVTESTLYAADSSDLLAFIDNISPEISSAMIVGHNPAFESCASELMDGARFEMGTASIACFQSDTGSWRDFRESCILKFFLHPKLVKKLI